MRILTTVKIHPANESFVSITSDDWFKARGAGELADGIVSVTLLRSESPKGLSRFQHDRRSVQ